MPQGQLQNYITNQTQSSSQPEQPPIQKFSFCIKGIGCKDIKCNDYHHPSKDLDILNASKKYFFLINIYNVIQTKIFKI